MMRNHRLSRKNKNTQTPRQGSPLRLIHLEDRVLPGEAWLGSLLAHAFLPEQQGTPRGDAERPAFVRSLPAAEQAAPAGRLQLLPEVGLNQGAATASETPFHNVFLTASEDADWGFAHDPLHLLAAFGPAPAARPALSPDEQGVDRGAGVNGGPSGPVEQPGLPSGAVPAPAPTAPLGDPYLWVLSSGGGSGPGPGDPGVLAPRVPVIIDPTRDGALVSPSVHMETMPFSDPNPNAFHYASEWEVRLNEPGVNDRIWTRYVTVYDKDNPDGSLLTHIHLGDGAFEGSHIGQTLLRPSANYRLRVRFENDSLETSPWAERTFQTLPDLPGDPDRRWAARQPGYQVEAVATDFKLPVNIAFVPNPTYKPEAPLYYVTELYGEVKVVTTAGHVRRFAGADASDAAQRPQSLVNFNPTGQFPGSGEQGTTGVVVDPNTGDVYVSTVWSIGGDAAGSPHYGRVYRLESDDGGLTAARRVLVLDTACRVTWPGGAGCPAGGDEAQGQSHQISNLTFGPDGYLYVHNGEGFDAARAQNVNNFGGKILRMNLDGSPVEDNPFFQAGCTHPVTGRPCARNYVYALGLRNPFGGEWWARNGRHYTVENGPGSNDRFSELVAGRNYGWNGTDASMLNFATYTWNPPQAPVNIAFIQPETFGGSGFPKEKWDHAFVSLSGPTYGQGPQVNGKRIQEFVLDPKTGARVGGPTTLIEYTGTGRASVVGLTVGPDGLYFTDLYRDDGVGGPTARGANVYRVRHVGQADFAVSSNATCDTTLTVQFADTSTGGSPPVAWAWNFGDGTTSTEQNPKHTYTQPGRYTVGLTVTDVEGNPRTVRRPHFLGVGRVGLRAEAHPFTDVNQIFQYTGVRQTRIDPVVNFNLDDGLTFPAIGRTNFYVRWTGQVITPFAAGEYVFQTVSDDGVRLWVNNQLLINNWTFHGPTLDTGRITLAANTAYDIRMDFFQGGGGGESRLRWTPPTLPTETIPQFNMCPTTTTNALVAPTNLRTTAVTADQIDLAWQNNAHNATFLVVERSTNGTDFFPIDYVAADGQTYTDRPGAPARYHYRIRAYNDVTDAVSAAIIVNFRIPTTPTNLRPTAVTANSVALAWDHDPLGIPYTGYRVERSVNDGPFMAHATVGQQVRTYTDTNLTAGVYAYRVRAINADLMLESDPSNVEAVAVGPRTLNFPNFGNPAGLRRNGDAEFVGNPAVARIARAANDRAGSLFTNYRVGIGNFTTEFTYVINGGSNPRADGMAFVIQGVSPAALGPTGGGMGYGPDQPNIPEDPRGILRSVCIKIDIFNNAGEGTNSTGIFTEGRSPSVRRNGLPPALPDATTPVNPAVVDLQSPGGIRVNLTYNGTTLNVMLTEVTSGRSFSQAYTVNIAALLGNLSVGYVGFTAGTGGLNTNFDVRSWQYQTT